MPPKKADKIPRKPAQEKVTWTRGKRRLESSTIIQSSSSTKVLNIKNQNKEAVPDLPIENIKVILANEVVRRQFPKKGNFVEYPDFSEPICVKKKSIVNRRRVLKKNVGEANDLDEPAPKRSRRKLKRPNEATEEVANETTLEQPKKQAQKTRITPKRTSKTLAQKVSADTSIDNLVNQEEETEKAKTVVKRKLPLNRETPISRPKTRQRANRIIKDESKIPNKSKVEETNINIENDLDDTRRSSLASDLSWTKCISSSSATSVTVFPNDNVCIDNKLPVLKLTNICSKEIHEKHVSDTNNITSAIAEPIAAHDGDFSHDGCDKSFSVDIDNFPHKNLSSSSSDSSSNESNSSVVDEPPSTLDKLASKLKLFDIQIIRWVGDNGYNSDGKVKEIQDKLFSEKFLKEEADLLDLCKDINRTLSKSNVDTEEIISKPTNETQINTNNSSLDESRNNRSNLDLEDTFEKTIEDDEPKKNTVGDKPSNCYKHPCGDNDEDDALSLYAESITGMESSIRKNNNIKFEEYVPEPVGDTVFKSPKLIIYKPSKIPVKSQSNVDDTPTVCMKQNADSTSIYREINENGNFKETYEDRTCNVKERWVYSTNMVLNQFKVKPVAAIKSILFKGVCFYNLTNKCNKMPCHFVHKLIEIDEIRKRLASLDDMQLKSEYAMLRTGPMLLKTYGRYFIDECIRRKQTRALVEIAIDLIRICKNNVNTDCVLEVEVMETILLYLNSVDIEVYDDVLRVYVKKGLVLCDMFLEVIAKTQNFFRFKAVFIKLTNFMFEHRRTFDREVAAHILERISILPYDEGLARALIKVLGNTDRSIFYNSMIGDFEQQLLKSNEELHVEFGLLRTIRLAIQPMWDNCYSSPVTDMDRLSTSMAYSEKNIRYSPDTTNLDNMNKTPTETKFTRTINNLNSHTNFPPNTNSTDYSEDKTPSNKFNHYNNKQMNVMNNMTSGRGRGEGVRMNMHRHPHKRRFEQSYEAGSNKLPRRSGPSFY